MSKIKFKAGDRIICKDKEFENIEGEILGVIINNGDATLYNVWLDNGEQQPFWEDELEFVKEVKAKKKKMPSLKQVSKEAEQEERDRIFTIEYLNGLNAFINMALNPTKKQKKAIRMMFDFDKENGLTELIKGE